MSVLESMRSGTDSTFMQVVFAAVVISFVAWGVGPSGDKVQTLVEVNGEAVSAIEYNRQVRNAEYSFQQRTGKPVTEDDRAQLREQVRQQMIRQVALRQEAGNLGLEVSDTEVAREIIAFRPFLDEDGVYDPELHSRWTRAVGYTTATFEDRLRGDLLVQKLQGLMMLGASVSDPIVQARYIDQNTKVNLSYVKARPSSFQKYVESTDADLATWIGANEAAIQARYDLDFERLYNKPERVTLSVIRLAIKDDGLSALDLKPKLDAVKAELEGGADFATVARKWSESPSAGKGGSQGELAVTQLEPEVVAAIAEVAEGALTNVVVTPRDLRLYRVDARTAAEVIPRETAQDDIALRLYQEETAPVLATSFVEEQLLPAWKLAGNPPEEVLASRGLAVQTTGLLKADGSDAGLFSPPIQLLKAATSVEVGTVLAEPFEDNGDLWVAQLTERNDPDMEAFETDHDKIREQALLQHRGEFFEAWVDDVVARATIE